MFDAIVFVKALVVGLSVAAPVGPVGALGVTWLIAALTTARVPLALGGAALLLGLAWRTWRAPLAAEAASTSGRGLWAAFGGTVLLTLANPATTISFIAVFGVLAAGVQGSVSPVTMIAGVFLGSAAWWLLLATVVSATRTRFDDAWRRRINIGSALVLTGFALWQVVIAVRVWL
jgi:threonine/homoserine/homoserine lactone efflux protein